MNEEQYLALVIEKLKTKIQAIDDKMSWNEKDIASMHEYFWDNYTEMDEYGYEVYDNSNALKSRIKEQGEYVKERFRYEKMLYSPYFARVDFQYAGEEESEKYYIGIGNLQEGRATDPYVFDWRAPISGLFYDYDQGPAEFMAPAGLIQGEITKKKQYKIKRGRLVYAMESEINIDDEILQQTLSEHANASLKSIVTTIQKEQNSIIRDTTHRILAVQGCAGSGKTSVALHRIAYLLYHNRKNLNAAQVLILSPNSIFADYISRILPELGEENICELTLDDFAYHELKSYGEAEDRYDEMEKLLHADAGKTYFITQELEFATRDAEYKKTKEYVKELDGFVLELETEIADFRDFHYKKLEMREEEIAAFFYEKLCDVPIFSRLKKIAEYLIDASETLTGRNMEEEEKFIIIQKMERMYETTNLVKIYNRFLRSTRRKQLDTSRGRIRYEDVYPLLYLKYATVEPPQRREVKHLIIDEMQDYSYLQYRIIERMFDCPMTILGDKVQTMGSEHQDVLRFLPKIFCRDIHKVYLNKSYRSTTEITDFANALIGEAGTESIKRHGEAPECEYFADEEKLYDAMAAKAKEFLEALELDTVAILTLDAAEAIHVEQEINARLGAEAAHRFHKDSMKFTPGISVMPFYLAKGLEFDAVLVPNRERYTSKLHNQALYINATRALHVLKLYGVK